MPFGKIKLIPGVTSIFTPTNNPAQLFMSNLIRFYKGLVQKRGGWAQRSATVIAGAISELHGWSDLAGLAYLGVGAAAGTVTLYINDDVGNVTNITPTSPPGAAVWSLDNFGQVLIANPEGHGIYKWAPGDPLATAIGGSSPTKNTSIISIPQVQIVAALGSEVGGVFNPLLIRWSDAGDYTSWTPTSTNQAGSYVVPQGSSLVGGLATGLTTMLWTDVGLVMMTYQGLPFVFGFQPLATGCGLFGRRAKGVIGTRVMWLAGEGKPGRPTQRPIGFFQMSLGQTSPSPLECDVWDIMYENADFGLNELFFMAVTEAFNEFELFFPLLSTSRYYVVNSVQWGSIKYNLVDNAWDYNISPQLQRTAWEHTSPVGNPVGADMTGLLQQHEIGYNANGTAMLWSWQTGEFDVAQGEEMMVVDWMIPDFDENFGPPPTISLTVGALLVPNAPPVTETFTVTPSTYWTPNFALRGRQFFLAASGSDLGTFNRIGAIRYRVATDGRGP